MAQLRNQVLSEEVARRAKSLEEHYIQARRLDARLGTTRGGRRRNAYVVRRRSGDGQVDRGSKEEAAGGSRSLAEFIQRCVGDVAFFGSRACDDFHDMGHWDLAAVTQDGEYAVKIEKFGQVVYILLTKLHQLLAFSMLILDVAYEGRLLCGRGEFCQEFAKG